MTDDRFARAVDIFCSAAAALTDEEIAILRAADGALGDRALAKRAAALTTVRRRALGEPAPPKPTDAELIAEVVTDTALVALVPLRQHLAAIEQAVQALTHRIEAVQTQVRALPVNVDPPMLGNPRVQ